MAIAVADGFQYLGAKPLDSRIKYDTLAAMKSVPDANLYDGCMAYCVATDKYYKWLSSNTVDTDLGKWREFEAGGGGETYTAGDGINIDENNEISTDNLQEGDIADCLYPVPTPTPGVTSLGGLTDVALTDPTNGQALIYNSTTHAWENGNGGTTYTAGDGIVIDQNNEISTDDLQSGDMDDILDTLPSIRGSYQKYSTTEQVIGEWLDGKPVYEISFTHVLTSSDVSGSARTLDEVTIANVNFIKNLDITVNSSSASGRTIPFYESNGNYFNCWFDFSSNKVQIICNVQSYANRTLYITLRYTKTTD